MAALALAGLHGGYRLGLITSMVAAVICLSIVVLTGYTGQISLAQMAFAGVAGFSLSRLSADLGVPFPLAPLLAAVAAGLVGLLIGLPARRGRGVNLAVVTLAAAVVVEQLVFENSGFTGGLAGSRVPDPAVLGLHLGIGGRRPGDFPSVAFGLVALAVLTITAVGVAELRTRGLGRRLLAVRGNERAAAAAGIDVGRTKLAAFVLSAFIAGIGGALVGYQQRSLSVESFGVFISLAFLAVTYLGGIAGVTGALVGGALASGGIVFAVLDDTAGLGRYQLLASGLGLVVVAVLSPDGVTGAASRLAARLATRVGPGGGGP
jgi:branched-chain amino acid transport system permease protein